MIDNPMVRLMGRRHRARLTELDVVDQSKVLAVATAVFGALIAKKAKYALARAPDVSAVPTPVEVSGYRPDNHDPDYLTSDEVRRFEECGYLGPYRLFSPNEAEQMREVIVSKLHGGRIIYGPYRNMEETERRRRLARAGVEDNLVRRAWYRHFNVREMHDVLTHPKIAKKMASLLGEHVILWRSQAFEIKAGMRGTGLHQTTFKIGMPDQALAPTTHKHNALVQLTAWVALTDATEEKACLQIMPGTHTTDFFDKASHLEAAMYLTTKLGMRTMWDAARQIAVSRMTGSNLAGLEIADFVYENVFKHYVPGLFTPLVPLPAKAGEFYIFTSSLVHGSRSNTTEGSRVALGGRYTTTDVRVMPDWETATDKVHFAPMVVEVPVSELGVTQVHGTDGLGLNKRAAVRFESSGLAATASTPSSHTIP